MRRLDPITVSWVASALVVAVVCVVVYLLYLLDSRPVVDYGTKPHSWFLPDRATKGQKIQQCFGEINWHRAECPGEYHWSWRTTSGALKTGQPHKISNPPTPRTLVGKCREFVVPDFAELGLNKMVDTYAANKCSWWHEWAPIRAIGPTDIELTVDP